MLKRLTNDSVSIILLGIIIRLLIIPFTMNWDMLSNTQLTGQLIGGDLAKLYSSHGAYPPLTHWTILASFIIFKPFLSTDFIPWLQLKDLASISTPLIFRYLFFLKLPMVAAEVFSSIIFSRLFEPSKRSLVLLIWLMNPLVIYTVPMFTNVDAFPVLFILLHFLFLKKGRYFMAAASLGIATSYKLFPIFFLPFFFLIQNNWKKRFIGLVSYLVPVIVSQIPALTIAQYRNSVLSGGDSMSILFSNIEVGPNRLLLYFPLFYFLIFFLYLKSKQKFDHYFIYSFLSLLPIFIFSLFHLQWILWIFPLILYYNVMMQKKKIVMLLFYLAYFGLVIFSQSSLNIGMFAPLEPTFWTFDWPLKQILNTHIYTLLNLFHTLITACIIWMSYSLLQSTNKKVF